MIIVNETPLQIDEIATSSAHPVTKETITKYKQLIDDLCKELRRLTQAYGEKRSNYHTEGMESVRSCVTGS